MADRIAVVGMALRYPDANTVGEYWENIVGGRRAFRPIPKERLSDAYYDSDRSSADRHYATHAAVLRDFEFDRTRWKVAGRTFRSTDLTHWLALTVADEAIADAGGIENPERVGVVVGNSLTGEFSRSGLLRLRWPYVEKTVRETLTESGINDANVDEFLVAFERRFKAPFPPTDADTLAGGLANTIAGRICNALDLGGGGYTVDGACSSSLLSACHAATALERGDLDMAVTGGVDLSIDPFELIGFAKTEALSGSEMRVYDARSDGFWPGEGCGMLVLMRESDARAQGRDIHALLTGWGYSSDGHGGITRPEAAGHRRAIAMAYKKAGYNSGTVGYFEGHGTGTAVGDATEIEVFAGAASDGGEGRSALGTVKANIGHTKAAAGAAGLIKAVLTVRHGVVPPCAGHEQPHPMLGEVADRLDVPLEPRDFPGGPQRAAVSGLGFGGINAHITVEGPEPSPGGVADLRHLTNRQDAELLLLTSETHDELILRATGLRDAVGSLSLAELGDLAATLAAEAQDLPCRAAVVARGAQDAARRAALLVERLTDEDRNHSAPITVADHGAVIWTLTAGTARIGYVFPGQGTGVGSAGAVHRRFGGAPVAHDADGSFSVDTNRVQPRVAAASAVALDALTKAGVTAEVAFGHSLGELVALHWGGSLDQEALVDLARERGSVMMNAAEEKGTMASLVTTPDQAEELVADLDRTVVAAINGPNLTVVAGPAEEVARALEKADQADVEAHALRVSHAFHSPLMQPAQPQLGRAISEVKLEAPDRMVVSTVTGRPVTEDDLSALLVEQLTRPVLFTEALATTAQHCDLLLEVGPGRGMTALIEQIDDAPSVIAVDTDSETLAGYLAALGSAFVAGQTVDLDVVTAGRLHRPLSLHDTPKFLTNPCELDGEELAEMRTRTEADTASAVRSEDVDVETELLERVAAHLELPASVVTKDTHPVGDLNLSSITVGQIANEIATARGLPPLSQSTALATVDLGELAQIIEATSGDTSSEITGVRDWVRTFTVAWREAPPSPLIQLNSPGSTGWEWAGSLDTEPELSRTLRDAFTSSQGTAFLALGQHDEAEQLRQAVHRAINADELNPLVIIQQGTTLAGFVKAVHLEIPHLPVTVVNLDVDLDVDEALAHAVFGDVVKQGFIEIRYDADRRRLEPFLEVADPVDKSAPLEIGPDDVIVVTGGGKSITFECALALAQESGCHVALLGRASPENDDELAQNLQRAVDRGISHQYNVVDVTDPDQVAEVVRCIEEEVGAVTGLLHGAGRNNPVSIRELEADELASTLRAKVGGLEHLLDAVPAGQLSHLITFGSIIGRAGLPGEAHYALANDQMTYRALAVGEGGPRVVALEFSVWAGAGMGERLGVVETLAANGVTPIGLTAGVDAFLNALRMGGSDRPLVVSGRTANGWSTLRYQSTSFDVLRFMQEPVASTPHVELVVDSEISRDHDPYLADHKWDGDSLFPAVIAIEAMVQVASQLVTTTGLPQVEDLRILRPTVVPGEEPVTVRVAALHDGHGRVEVALRSSETGFAADHVTATISWSDPEAPALKPPTVEDDLQLVPSTDLYGPVMFQGPLFQAVEGYTLVRARHTVARLRRPEQAGWFAPHLAAALRHADPSLMDAAMHSLQACIPTRILLPEAVERIVLYTEAPEPGAEVLLEARERHQDGTQFVYDVDLFTGGQLWAQWTGLTLSAVEAQRDPTSLPPPLLASHLEREIESVLGTAVAFVVDGRHEQQCCTSNGAESRATSEPEKPEVTPDAGSSTPPRHRSEKAAARVGLDGGLDHRPDGKPESPNGDPVSISHLSQLTMLATGDALCAVDFEEVKERDWRSLLPSKVHNLLDVVESHAPPLGHDGAAIPAEAVAGAHVWSAIECLRKSERPESGLHFASQEGDWIVFNAGGARIASNVIARADHPHVVAVMVGECDA